MRVWLSAFNIFEEPDGSWDALPPAAMKPRGPNASGFAVLDFLTLDDYCARAGPPDLIKIDVEAYQTKAVSGAKEVLQTAKPAVIIELHDAEKTARLSTSNAETVSLLREAGYRGYVSRNFRDPDAVFEPLEVVPETLCLAVFVPC